MKPKGVFKNMSKQVIWISLKTLKIWLKYVEICRRRCVKIYEHVMLISNQKKGFKIIQIFTVTSCFLIFQKLV